MMDIAPAPPADRPALDWLAVTAAAGCAVHCVALPFVVAALPAIGAEWLGDERLGSSALAISILLAALALTQGCRRHRSLQPLLLAALGFAALIGAEAGPETSTLGSVVLSASGGLLIVGAHMINRSLCLTCGACSLSEAAQSGPCRGGES